MTGTAFRDWLWLAVNTLFLPVVVAVVFGAGFGVSVGVRAGLFVLAALLVVSFFSSLSTRKLTSAIPAGPEYGRVQHILERVCVQAGCKPPRLYVINDRSLNACAFDGVLTRPGVAFTVGLEQHLSNEELAGVLAHEVAHLKHKDSYVMTASVASIGILSSVANACDAFAWYMGAGEARSPDPDTGKVPPARGPSPLGFVGIVIGAALTILALFFYFLSRLAMFALSRNREFKADARAADILQTPYPLCRALEKISYTRVDSTPKPESTAHMWISQPTLKKGPRRRARLFDTHPPTSRRIEALLEAKR